MSLIEKNLTVIELSPEQGKSFKPQFPYEFVDHKGRRYFKLSSHVYDQQKKSSRLLQVAWLTLEQAEELGKGIMKALRENGGSEK